MLASALALAVHVLAVEHASFLSSTRDNAMFVLVHEVAQIADTAHAGVNGQSRVCGVSTSYMVYVGKESWARGGLV